MRSRRIARSVCRIVCHWLCQCLFHSGDGGAAARREIVAGSALTLTLSRRERDLNFEVSSVLPHSI